VSVSVSVKESVRRQREPVAVVALLLLLMSKQQILVKLQRR
jgi:hypothetical protein